MRQKKVITATQLKIYSPRRVMAYLVLVVAIALLEVMATNSGAAAEDTTRVSVSSPGAQANYGGDAPSISSNGRFVAFGSDTSNLVDGDNNDVPDIFVRD